MLPYYLVSEDNAAHRSSAHHGVGGPVGVVKVPPSAAPQLGSCAASRRAWWFWAARHSQEEAGPLDAQPPPRVLELAASKSRRFHRRRP